MNEIQLSSDINVITAEINSYKQIAGQSIWEIGRRLNYVKENDLAHGEFGKWLEKVEINHSTANKFMKIANELSNSYSGTNIGWKALSLIATLPEEERTKQHETSKGEVKKPDEMTVRELQELKKQLKQKDKQIENLSDVITELDNRKPEVIEKIPYDYSSTKNENEELKKELESTKRNLKLSKMQYELLEKNTEEARNLEKNINSLRKKEQGLADRVKATMEFNDLLREINMFFDKNMASLRFKPLVDELYDTEAVNKLSDVIGTVEFWTEEMRKMLPNQNTRIIEGEIIDE